MVHNSAANKKLSVRKLTHSIKENFTDVVPNCEVSATRAKVKRSNSTKGWSVGGPIAKNLHKKIEFILKILIIVKRIPIIHDESYRTRLSVH